MTKEEHWFNEYIEETDKIDSIIDNYASWCRAEYKGEYGPIEINHKDKNSEIVIVRSRNTGNFRIDHTKYDENGNVEDECFQGYRISQDGFENVLEIMEFYLEKFE